MQAQDYTDMGFSVFPLIPKGKTPYRGSKGVHAATTNMANIKRWQRQHPDSNIAIATGMKSTVIALDIDPRNGGRESYAKLIKTYGPNIDETLTAITGSDGRHKYCTMPDDVPIKTSHGALGDGIDVQSDGAYCVAAQSIHPNGKPYTWRDGLYQPEPIPDALLGAILSSQSKENSPRFKLPAKIKIGERDNVLMRLACSLRGYGKEFDAIHEAISKANAEKCATPLCEADLIRIASSATRYAKNKRNGKTTVYRQTILKAEGLKPTSIALLHTLLAHADNETLAAFPSQETLAKEVGCGDGSIRSHSRALRDLGWLKMVKKSRPDGKAGSQIHYTLTFPENQK